MLFKLGENKKIKEYRLGIFNKYEIQLLCLFQTLFAFVSQYKSI